MSWQSTFHFTLYQKACISYVSWHTMFSITYIISLPYMALIAAIILTIYYRTTYYVNLELVPNKKIFKLLFIYSYDSLATKLYVVKRIIIRNQSSTLDNSRHTKKMNFVWQYFRPDILEKFGPCS